MADRGNTVGLAFPPEEHAMDSPDGCIHRPLPPSSIKEGATSELCSPGHPEPTVSLSCLAIHLHARYTKLGSMRDLDEAIVLGREALLLRPKGHPDRSRSLSNLADDLFARYQQLGLMEDLDEAIILGREAFYLRPPLEGHSGPLRMLSNLSVYLSSRYKQRGEMGDLSEAISLNREALDLCPRRHPYRSALLNNLAADLSVKYQILRVTKDLDEAVVLNREALALRPRGHPDRPTSLNSIANHFFIQYRELGIMEYLDEAITLDREALDLLPERHPHRLLSLSNLAVRLSARYNQLGTLKDLDEATDLDRQALDLRPPGHPDRASSLSNLSNRLFTQYKRLGAMEHLDEAVILSREALELCRKGQSDRFASLNSLAFCLSARYDRLGVMEDLDEAIVLNREALDLWPRGHPNRSYSLSNLSINLSTKFKQLGVIEHLDEAIIINREALELCPKGHSNWPSLLSNLARCLITRFDHLGVMADFTEALVLNIQVLDLRPQGHPDRSITFSSLAVCLFTRYRHLGFREDLDWATAFVREALELQPQGHPCRSASLDNLARHLYIRFALSRRLEDKEEMFSLFSQLLHVPQVTSSGDLAAARGWVSVAEAFQHPTLLDAYETSLRFLAQHLATLPSLPQHLPILKALSSFLAVDAFSACLRNRSPAKAVELLEQGRGIFWSQRTHLRSPLDDVIATGTEGRALADEFTRLTSHIRSAFNSFGADQHERVCHLNIALQRVVANIRRLPGLSKFLLPSLFSDLQHAARDGPVIIVNASEYSCDALVILLDRDPVHIPLQITLKSVQDLAMELRTFTARTRIDMTRELAAFLRKLWDNIVSPIVDFLQTILPPQSRIWWCPTGEFSALPLHAAAPYRKGQSKLTDLYISSYTPTLTALVRARQRDPSSLAMKQKRFVAIGQANAAGERKLPSVAAELDTIGNLISDVATFTRIDDEESCISRVVEELGRNEWVHLACHGLPNRSQPFESAFALHDGRFTIQRIIGCDLKNPEFVYLSACHTTVGDEGSPDEVMHLASAMQFVGFRSVIGTMWAVDDGETNEITSTFYRHMMDESGRLDYTRAALALHTTMKSVRVPLDQRILYIHLGA